MALADPDAPSDVFPIVTVDGWVKTSRYSMVKGRYTVTAGGMGAGRYRFVLWRGDVVLDGFDTGPEARAAAALDEPKQEPAPVTRLERAIDTERRESVDVPL